MGDEASPHLQISLALGELISMKILILLPAVYFLTLLQTSFLVFFDFRGYVLNLVLVSVLLLNLFENSRSDSGLILAIFGGFLLDIFSSGLFGFDFIGFWTIALFIFSLFIKYFLKKWTGISIIK